MPGGFVGQKAAFPVTMKSVVASVAFKNLVFLSKVKNQIFFKLNTFLFIITKIITTLYLGKVFVINEYFIVRLTIRKRCFDLT